jgi:hypothetical protein
MASRVEIHDGSRTVQVNPLDLLLGQFDFEPPRTLQDDTLEPQPRVSRVGDIDLERNAVR